MLNNKKDIKKNLKEWKKVEKATEKFDFTGDIVLDNTSYTYSKNSPFEFRALDFANLTIKDKKITCVIGTTGSGKSTMIQLTNGLLLTETGQTIVGNYKIPAGTKKIRNVKQLRKEIGLVFQFPEYQLFQDTIEKDIAFGPIHLGENKQKVMKRIPELLDLVQIPRDYASRSPFELSGGQKRRVAIAGIIAMDGKTLVLDEPTGGLDPKGEENFLNLFIRLNKKDNKRIIMVTHNMDHVLKSADEVIVMHEGKVIGIGTPFEIFSDEKLLTKIQIEPPKVYKLLYSIKKQGIDLLDQNIRTIEEFAKAFKKHKKGK